MKTLIKVWYLEMTEPPELKTGMSHRNYSLHQVKIPFPELNRFLYGQVGADWCWYLRLKWTYQQWMDYLNRDEVQTWVASVDGVPAGYFELDHRVPDAVEIAYFGLVPEFIGKGMGKYFLQDAIARSWQLGGKRIWLHTCNLDHPRALQNYLALGFRIFKTEEYYEDIPDYPLQPWPGADKPTRQ